MKIGILRFNNIQWCFKIGFTPQSGYFDGENCRWPMDFGVPYFQTNLDGIDNLQSGWWYEVC